MSDIAITSRQAIFQLNQFAEKATFDHPSRPSPNVGGEFRSGDAVDRYGCDPQIICPTEFLRECEPTRTSAAGWPDGVRHAVHAKTVFLVGGVADGPTVPMTYCPAIAENG